MAILTFSISIIFIGYHGPNVVKYVLTLSNAKHGGKYWNRSRGKLDFKGPQAKTTEPLDSTKVTYCSIQLG